MRRGLSDMEWSARAWLNFTWGHKEERERDESFSGKLITAELICTTPAFHLSIYKVEKRGKKRKHLSKHYDYLTTVESK